MNDKKKKTIGQAKDEHIIKMFNELVDKQKGEVDYDSGAIHIRFTEDEHYHDLFMNWILNDNRDDYEPVIKEYKELVNKLEVTTKDTKKEWFSLKKKLRPVNMFKVEDSIHIYLRGFNTLEDASKYLDHNIYKIGEVCDGRRKDIKGFKFRWFDRYEDFKVKKFIKIWWHNSTVEQ